MEHSSSLGLNSGIEFQALSYTWADATGDFSRSSIVYLGRRWDVFKITANCKAGLLRMRRKDRDVMVWVDAICVDQGNHVERSHQVGLMRSIYNAAWEVFVYLGEGSSWSDEALERLRWAKHHQTMDDKGRKYLIDFLNMQYFHRIWIIQEIFCAQSATMYCGDQSLGWSILDTERLGMLGILGSVPRWISSMYRAEEYTTRDLAKILLSTKSSGASDPRDKVFAILGLIKDADEHCLVADYNLTVEEVDIGIAAFLILNHNDCSILEYAATDISSSLPTWIPTWETQARHRGADVHIPRGSEKFGNQLILRSKHLTSHLTSVSVVGDLDGPRIHHLWGSLSILALKLMDLSFLESPWVKCWSNKGLIINPVAGQDFAIRFEVPFDYADEIVLLKGCDALFQIRKSKNNGFIIVGVCNILLPSNQLSGDENENPENANVVSRFIRLKYPFHKPHIRQVIRLEAVLKRLDIWDDEKCPSPVVTVSDSMILEAAMERAFTGHINQNDTMLKESTGFSQSEHEISDLDAEGLHNDRFPMSSQVQWLQARLSFWDNKSSWMKIETLRDIYSDWLRWRILRANLETTLFAWVSGNSSIRPDGTKKSLQEFESYIKGDVLRLAFLTSTMTDRLERVTGLSRPHQCCVQIGKKRLVLLQRIGFQPPPKQIQYDVEIALQEVVAEHYVNSRTDLKTGTISGFHRTNLYHTFTDWDWSELETIFEGLAPVNEKETLDLQRGCSSRMFLRKLHPQVRAWERINIF